MFTDRTMDPLILMIVFQGVKVSVTNAAWVTKQMSRPSPSRLREKTPFRKVKKSTAFIAVNRWPNRLLTGGVKGGEMLVNVKFIPPVRSTGEWGSWCLLRLE